MHARQCIADVLTLKAKSHLVAALGVTLWLTLSYGYEEGCHSVGNYTAIVHWQHLLFRGMARCRQDIIHPV